MVSSIYRFFTLSLVLSLHPSFPPLLSPVRALFCLWDNWQDQFLFRNDMSSSIVLWFNSIRGLFRFKIQCLIWVTQINELSSVYVLIFFFCSSLHRRRSTKRTSTDPTSATTICYRHSTTTWETASKAWAASTTYSPGPKPTLLMTALTTSHPTSPVNKSDKQFSAMNDTISWVWDDFF